MAKHYLTLVMGWLCCVAFVLSPSDVSAETFGTIKGRVWNDLNNNHLQDPNEMGMSTVWVQVETSAGGWVNGGYTDMSGEYNFANIPGGGSYRVKIANPANGFNGVTPNEGNDDSIDSDVDIFGFSSVFTLAVGQTVDIDGGFTTGGQCYTPVTATVSNIQCVGGNQFTFQITATGGTAFGGQSWGWNYPAGGLMKQPYGQPVTVGPFSGCNGTVTVTISDVDNPFCTATVSAEAPANCCGGSNLTFNCQNNITVTAAPGANGTVVTFNAPTATTTCPGGATTVTQISGPASGSVFPLGTTQVCFKATDNCGNEKTCCFNVTVNPGTSTLTFNCQNNITVTAAPGASGTVVTFNAPTATTTCPGGATTVTQISGPASGSVFPLGTTQVCFKATDNCGNEKTCCFNVTVNPGGGTPDCETITFTPTATNSNTGQITIGNLTAPIVLIQVFNASWAQVFSCVGNCNTPTQVVSGLSVGTYYVKVDYLTANWSPICTKQLYVTIPPGNSCDNVTNGGTIGSDATVCPGNVFVSLSSLSLPTGGTGTIEYQWISSTTTCPTNIGQAIAGATSATYSPGTLTQTTWYVRLARRAGCTDWAGASNCVKITVSNLGCGNTSLICPNDINVTAAVNQTTAVVTYPDPQISTTCTGSVNVTRISGLASGSAFPVGTTQVCFKATDDCGNEKTCCFNVTVNPPPPSDCDEDTDGCIKVALQSITVNANNSRTYKFKITSNCEHGLSYAAFQLPGSVTATAPGSSYTGTSGKTYSVENTTNNPFYSIKFNTTSVDGIKNGQMEVFEFTLPASAPVLANIKVEVKQSTYTRLVTLSTANCGGSNVCDDVTNGGTIGSDQTLCPGSAPTTLTNVTSPTGGTGTIEYQWISSTTGCPTGIGQAIAGATSATYSPGSLTQTTWFVRLARRAGCSDYSNGASNCVKITVSNVGCSDITFNCQNNITTTTVTGTAIVYYTAPTATTTCPNGGATVTRISGPASGSAFPVGTTQVCFKATDNCGNEKTCCFTVTVTSCPTPPNTVCFVSPTKPHVSAQITTVDNGSTLTIRTTFSKGFVDNTYGTNAIGWPGGHTFNNLVGSDHVQLALYNGAGTKSLEFKIDYISASNAAPSGYKSLGVLDGEGKMLVGSASSIISATTSLDVNFNQYGYVLTTNSPATNASYAPNATYPNWIYEVWYEVTVSKAAFGASGYGRPEIASVHASPSKTGSNTEVVVPTPCPVTPPPCGAITFVCQPDISVTTTTGSAVVTYTTPTGTTTCPAGGLSVVRTSGPASGSSFPVGTTQVCFQVTDACGNLQNCCFNVVVTTPPPVTDCCNGSKISDITLKYTGQSCSATTHTQDPSKVSCSGNPNGATSVRIVAQNSNGSKKWFDGTVALNGIFTIQASNGGATRLESDTYVKIYSTSGTLLQDIKFHTSCSQPIAPGNQFGSVKIEGIKFENGTTCGTVDIPPVCVVTRTVDNSVEKNDGTSCSNGQTYGVWLNAKWPGSSSESSKYFKISGSTFVENADGTVTMNGLATNNSLSKVKFQVSINFCGRTFVAPSGSPKTADCYNISTGNWYYYTSFCGTLTGQEDAAGAVLKIAKTGPAFQVGVGANLNESSQFGASGWFTVQIQSHPSNKTLTFNSGDINIRLSGAATTAACGPGTVNCPSCTNGGLEQAEGLTFNAFRKGQTADLQWVSRTGQVAANYFVVERSADGSDFTPIKMVNATGNTLETEYHNTNDAQPLKGDNFYRVREVLTDGTERYSSIEKVTMPDTRSLDIYPNPANANKVWMDVSQFEGQAIRITLYNQLGSIAKTFDIAEAPENAVELNIEGLGSGFYGVEVTAANGVRRTVKLVVNRVE